MGELHSRGLRGGLRKASGKDGHPSPTSGGDLQARQGDRVGECLWFGHGYTPSGQRKKWIQLNSTLRVLINETEGRLSRFFLKKLFLCALDMNFQLLFSPMVEINLLCPVHKVYPGNVVTKAEKRPLWGLSRPYYVCLVY